MRTLFQLGTIGALALGAGVLSNLARSGNPEKFLEWNPGRKYDLAAPPAPSAKEAGTSAPAGTPAPSGTAQTPSPAAPEETAEGGFRKIDLAEALEYAHNGATFIDARRSREYREGHISGAYPVSAWENTGERINAILQQGEVVEEAPVVVYCSSDKECKDSAVVAGLLQEAGFVDIVIYKGGFPEWEHKLPGFVEKGDTRGELDLARLPAEVPAGTAQEGAPQEGTPEEGTLEAGVKE
jgi:rhodanese-related sulfurtransferase